MVTLAPGQRFGEYEIVARLGAGGMGEVWRARDGRLEREVALKVLPAATAADAAARVRLLREARLASKLNHPNVCTIYEVGEAEGQAYIAMELVAGQALSQRLSGRPLAMDEAVRLGQQMADALSHAHERGVVHRDFKSPNVIVTEEGRAKVLDFGLAKRLAGEDLDAATTLTEAALTEPGAIVGTLAYMAPEQLKGRLADERSDVWALGVVLHEMVSGARPFQGGSAFELTSAILKETPRPLPASVPRPLAAVIGRCLAKEPAQRYQQAAEVRSALEALQAGTEPTAWPEVRSALVARRRQAALAALAVVIAMVIALVVGLDVGGLRGRLLGPGADGEGSIRMAVLPFANLSGDPEQEYLSDGLTQEMITQLGRLHPESLSVIARSSVMRYKTGDTPVDQIGRELKVKYVLEGSAQREANRVRIATELIQVGDQTQIWAETYERELSGILALQSEVARRVAEALALELLPEEQARLSSARTVDPEAYEAYLKGTYHWQKLTPQDLDTAQRYFELALERDSTYAPGFEGIAWVWSARQLLGITLPGEAGPRAKKAALQAISLDDGSAGAHEALAGLRTWTDWDWAGAWPEWRRALELDPNAATARAFYAHFLAIVGRTDEAVAHSEQALELDPFNALLHGLYSWVLYYERRYDDAMAAARTALAMEPNQVLGSFTVQAVYISKGMREEQLTHQRKRIAADPERVAAFEQGLEEGGYEGAQRRIADLLATRYERAGGVPDSGVMRIYMPCSIALRYVDAGDLDLTMDWLERAYEVRDPNLPYLGLPLYYDALRSNPRYLDLLRRMNLPLHPDQPLETGSPRLGD